MIALLGVTAGGLGVWRLTRHPPQQPLAVKVETLEELPQDVGISQHIAVSPDGKHLVYVVGQFGVGLDTHLVHQPLNRFEATVIPGSEGASFPFFSPDSLWVGFSVDGDLKKVSLDGGHPVDLCNDCGGSATWSPDGLSILAVHEKLWRISADGRSITGIMEFGDGRRYFSRPHYLPDGRSLLMEFCDQKARSCRIGVLDLETNLVDIVVSNGSNPTYAESGHLVFARNDELYAVAFDPGRRICTGEPVRVLRDVSYIGYRNAQYSVSRQGLMAYIEWSDFDWAAPDRTLVWVDRSGEVTPLNGRHERFNQPKLSPDGSRIASVIVNDRSTSQIEIYEIETKTWARLTMGGNWKACPLWTPDGRHVVFSKTTSGGYQIFSTASDFSTDDSTRLFDHTTHAYPSSFSPSGDLVFSERVGTVDLSILLHPSDGGAVREIVHTPFTESGGVVSPDGRWLAYTSNRSGTDEVYVERFPDGGPRFQVSSGGGSYPRWAPSGDEIFYIEDTQMISVPVRVVPDFGITGDRQVLFEHDTLILSSYDVAPDGQRFLMILSGAEDQREDRARNHVNLIFNWFEELERLVPTD